MIARSLAIAAALTRPWAPTRLPTLTTMTAGSGYTPYGPVKVDEEVVDSLLAERVRLRRARKFEAADAVRDQLNQMGVTIWDKDLLWTYGDSPPPPRRQSGEDDGWEDDGWGSGQAWEDDGWGSWQMTDSHD